MKIKGRRKKEQNVNTPRSWYGLIARKTAESAGQPSTFTIALLIIIIWGITGPLFGYSDTWQLVINTGTTIITFLMGFLIQNTQGRDTDAIQIKLDELIRTTKGARKDIIGLEDLSEDQLILMLKRYKKLTRATRKLLLRNADGSFQEYEVPNGAGEKEETP
ncbi:low affinity iron permease family protein [Synechococcus sp. 1G10]|uniref:low affinity iron permease family protein n=1 Tax=Synechococcus sp. 1G10 TaxID=2025605 RepID=UPI000B9848A7|nr:low affinity iron permease family protein [Synechococcus sp. 1G10]